MSEDFKISDMELSERTDPDKDEKPITLSDMVLNIPSGAQVNEIIVNQDDTLKHGTEAYDKLRMIEVGDFGWDGKSIKSMTEAEIRDLIPHLAEAGIKVLSDK